LIVPENRNKPDSAPIRVHVAIFKSTNPNPKPDPVIYVAGGGGVDQLNAAEPYVNGIGAEMLKERDFIMYNQRGANLNAPSMVCPDLTNFYLSLAAQELAPKEKADQKIEKRLECHDDLISQGIDLTGYNTVETAGDLNDLRKTLGYEQWNLYGTSSGTRTILTLMRIHPEGIRSVILDSVYPPQVDLYSTFSLSVDRVFSLVFEDCASDPDCNQKYPDLEKTFYQLIDDMNANPISYELNGMTILLDGNLFMEALWTSFFLSDSVALTPGRILRAKEGGFTGLEMWVSSLLSDTGKQMAIGFEWSMMCNEEVPFESYEVGRQFAANLPPQLGHYFDSYFEFTLCESWQSGIADPVENEAVVSDIPALVLAGEYDPITPPEWGRLAAETLSNHFFFEFPGLTHGIVRSNTCGMDLAIQFINDPTNKPDITCMQNLPSIEFE
jgi:pimeloyl-ACP methyl ester carboxylesterase